MNITAIVWPSAGRVELADQELEAPGPQEVLIETVLSVVSPGTEAEWLRSDASHFVLGTTFPFVPGYSRLGRVAAVGRDVEGWHPGDRAVAAFDNLGRPLGAHASHGLVRAEDLDRIPDGVTFEQASLFLLGQTAFFTTTLAETGPDEGVIVVGVGPIGNLAVQFARIMGATPIVAVDLDRDRLDRAAAAGATHLVDASDSAALSDLAGLGIRRVIDLSGNVAGTNTAIRMAGPRGRVILSTASAEPMTLDYGQIFVKGLQLVGAFVNSDAALARAGTRAYLRHVAAGDLDVGRVITQDAFRPEDAPAIYERILGGDRSLGAPLIRWAED